MKKTLMLAVMLIAAVSCTKYSATVSGNIAGLDRSQIVIETLNLSWLTPVDTVTTKANGDFSYKVALSGQDPAFYYIYRNGVKLAGLVLQDGDRVIVNADTLGNYTVEGSPESSNLKYVDDALAKAASEMVSILNREPEDMNAQLSRVYVNHKRDMLKQIMSNPRSITSATTLFQKFNDDLPLFNESTDILIFRSIYDSLATVYPNSEFVAALKNEINRREKESELGAKLDALSQQSFPDIKMNDISGKEHSLLELEGKVIILSFWSIGQDEHKAFNQELTELYSKYHDSGLEVYQVSLDVDKPTWASTVRSQKLPWISVNDGRGINSPVINAYNLVQIPTMFVIGRDGEILAKDVYDVASLEPIIRKAL